MNKIKLIECPRDAMQGWKDFIPTDKKIAYLNALLKVGFDTLDFGSFVSPKAIPQMADTKELVKHLDLASTKTKLLAIIANERGAEEAAAFEEITYLGFPFSISETFQLRNTNATIEEAFVRLQNIQKICLKHQKQLVVYISMGFGNPYGDMYNEEILFDWAKKIEDAGVKIISLADTVGLATAAQVGDITSYLVKAMPHTEIGVHLHSTHTNWKEKLSAAYSAGCKRFDGALKGIGGCPMANDELVGNMATEKMIDYFKEINEPLGLDIGALDICKTMANEIFI